MIRRPPRSTLFPYHDALPILPELKKYLSSNIPRGVWTYLLVVTRLTVDSCIPISLAISRRIIGLIDRKSTRLNSSHANISYAVFCLKKKKKSQIYFILYNKYN